jgi:hypothetical protein
MQQQQAQFHMMMMQQQAMVQQQQQMNPSDPALQQYAAAVAAQHHAYATHPTSSSFMRIKPLLSNRYMQAMYTQSHVMHAPSHFPSPASPSSSPHNFM